MISRHEKQCALYKRDRPFKEESFMKKTEEMSRPIGVEELADVARKQPEIYAALKHYCMNRGFAELRRYAKK